MLKTEKKAMLSKRMKALRKSCGWTQKQLAKISGVHENTIMAFEAGKREVHTDTLNILLDAMGYEIAIIRKGAKTPPSPMECRR